MKKRQVQKQRQRRRDGFTLLEVLLVLAILGVIAAMVIPNLLGTQVTANIRQSKITLKTLENTLKQFAIDHDGNYPESIEDLRNPVDRDGNQMPPYLDEEITDAWGHPLNYEKPQSADERGILVARIWSNGPNGENDDGSGDDINNWDRREEQQ